MKFLDALPMMLHDVQYASGLLLRAGLHYEIFQQLNVEPIPKPQLLS